jgi:hypothetical protein
MRNDTARGEGQISRNGLNVSNDERNISVEKDLGRKEREIGSLVLLLGAAISTVVCAHHHG